MLIRLPRFVDRDMFMRYLGGGAYHTIRQKFLSIKNSFRKILEGAGLCAEDVSAGSDDDDDDDDDDIVMNEEDDAEGEEEDRSDDSDDGSEADSDVDDGDDGYGAF